MPRSGCYVLHGVNPNNNNNKKILLRCNGFTEMQDIVKLIAHSPESTVTVKYTVNLIQNFVKPNIKSFYFFKTFYII